MNTKLRGRTRNEIRCLLGLVLLMIPLAAYSHVQEQGTARSQAVDPAISQKLATAYDYHELALLYIRKGEPEEAVAEARKMIDLRIPPPFEQSVAESVSIITQKLAETGRYESSQNLLDDALKAMVEPANQVRILRTKARLYKLAGDDDRAIESWRRAQELESRRTP
jgi:tetratricopeptide (TPR) repeat protein